MASTKWLNPSRSTFDDTKSANSHLSKSGNKLKLVTWNIDGQDENNCSVRIKKICNMIRSISPHVFFFQEVTASNRLIIDPLLFDYQLLSSNQTPSASYFTLIGLHKNSVKLLNHYTTDFKSTEMDRNLNEAVVDFKGVKIRLMTTHLESMAKFSSTRKEQLSECFRRMEAAPDDEVVVFGGDLNLRDEEYLEVGSSPSILDIWEITGSKRNCKVTWDMFANDNHTFSKDYYQTNRRFRYDRLYLRDFKPGIVSPSCFFLIGKSRIKPELCFPSDHWGILTALKFFRRARQ